jgi:predicted transporter
MVCELSHTLSDTHRRASIVIDSMCPICLTSFLALLSEEETAIALDSPAHPVEELGVTKLKCAHVICRRE